MSTTAPIFAETDPDSGHGPAAPELPRNLPDRVIRLEGEVAELRETIARFAELVIGEVKDLRQSHAELPPMPPAVAGELPVTKIDHPEASAAVPSSTVETQPSRRPWLLMELLRDFTTTIRMYLDPRYRVRRATQMLVPLIGLLFACNILFFGYFFSLPILSKALEKLVDVVLAVLLYKVVSRELVRYRQVIAQLAAWHEYRVKNTAVVVHSEPAMTRLETE